MNATIARNPPSPLEQIIHDVEEKLSQCRQTMDQLTGRLEPVMGPGSPMVRQTGMNDPLMPTREEQVSPMGMRLSELHARLRDMHLQLQDVISRLAT